MKKTFLLIFLALLFLSLVPAQTQAGLVPCGCVTYDKQGNCCASAELKKEGEKLVCVKIGKPCQFCDLFVLFDNIIDFILINIIPPVAVLLLAIGGGMLIFSAGNPERLNEAKKLMTVVLIGLVIIYAAWLVVNLFFQVIGVAEWTGLKTWWEIPCP